VSVVYAKGRDSPAACDRCGLKWKLHQLRLQVVNQFPTNQLVCPDCLDKDHPQLWLGKVPVVDPQALRNPRPDRSILMQRALFGWNPVGDPSLCKGRAQVGTVIVRTT
jgi:hypothetical protein